MYQTHAVVITYTLNFQGKLLDLDIFSFKMYLHTFSSRRSPSTSTTLVLFPLSNNEAEDDLKSGGSISFLLNLCNMNELIFHLWLHRALTNNGYF